MRSFKSSRRSTAFTLVELLVTVALIGILASIVLTLFMSARARSRAFKCLHNQQQISFALTTFYMDRGHFPEDGALSDMALQLSAYIDWPASSHAVRLPDVYRCPNDRAGVLTNSYQPFYVQRKDPSGSDFFILGCPRHVEVDNATINLYSSNIAARNEPGSMKLNGQTVANDAETGQRTIRSGTMTFQDGSTVTVTSADPAYQLTAVASFRQSDGRLYTIVRVSNKGEAKFTITPGSRFEVVTPAALIGVRGTQFTVKSTDSYSKITLSSGSVAIWNKGNQEQVTLKNTGVYEAFLPGAMCIKCPKHCSSTKHCTRCPLHVGLPLNIGTTSCVQCSMHCLPKGKSGTLAHECQFCPLSSNNKVSVK